MLKVISTVDVMRALITMVLNCENKLLEYYSYCQVCGSRAFWSIMQCFLTTVIHSDSSYIAQIACWRPFKNGFHGYHGFFLCCHHFFTESDALVSITAVGIMAYYLRYCYSLITSTFIINIFHPGLYFCTYYLPAFVSLFFYYCLLTVLGFLSRAVKDSHSLQLSTFCGNDESAHSLAKCRETANNPARVSSINQLSCGLASEAAPHASRLHPGPDSIRTECAARSEANASLTVNVTF